VASKTDEPDWAHFCLDHLVIGGDQTVDDDDEYKDTTKRPPIVLGSCFQRQGKSLVEISYGTKTHHFHRLHQKTGIPYEEMTFFDNEYGNIRDVSKLGVHCFYTPDGMMVEDWEKAKSIFGLDTTLISDAATSTPTTSRSSSSVAEEIASSPQLAK